MECRLKNEAEGIVAFSINALSPKLPPKNVDKFSVEDGCKAGVGLLEPEVALALGAFGAGSMVAATRRHDSRICCNGGPRPDRAGLSMACVACGGSDECRT